MGGENEIEAQDIIDTIRQNNTKCTVCGSQDWTVEVLVKNLLPKVIDLKVYRTEGMRVISAVCQNCKYVMLFNDSTLNR